MLFEHQHYLDLHRDLLDIGGGGGGGDRVGELNDILGIEVA